MNIGRQLFLVLLLSTSTAVASDLTRSCYMEVRNDARSIQVEAAAILVNVEQNYQQQMDKSGEATINVQARSEANGAKNLLDAVQAVIDRSRLSEEQSQVLSNLCKADMNIFKALSN
jgi:hypothetical protein